MIADSWLMIILRVRAKFESVIEIGDVIIDLIADVLSSGSLVALNFLMAAAVTIVVYMML